MTWDDMEKLLKDAREQLHGKSVELVNANKKIGDLEAELVTMRNAEDAKAEPQESAPPPNVQDAAQALQDEIAADQ